ncbi:MAG: hypothetical protein IKU25_03925 [Clostridia bacterium]|nr:hypothetical protein [Clostridia bacterium]
MKNEMITYRPDESEQILIDASQKALEGLGLYGGNSQVDTSYELLTALSDAVKRSNLILVLVTKSEYIKIKKIVSKSLGIELVKNNSVAKKLGRLSEDKEFQLHDNFPKGSVVLDSKDALYSGYYLKSGDQCIVFSPLDAVRTEGILEKAGIKLNIECIARRKVRFIGIPKALVEKSLKEIGGVKTYSVTDSVGELELDFETVGSTYELAEQQSNFIVGELRKIYRSKLYGVDCALLPYLLMSEIDAQGKQLAIADTENSSGIVSYLATDRRAGETCKKIRVSSAQLQAVSQEEVSELAKKVRNRSGFDLAVAIGDESYDEEKKRSFIYASLANEQGVLTKRFWRQPGEGTVDFRTRCAKELMLLLYNDRTGDEYYSSMKQNAKREKPPKQEKAVKKPSKPDAKEPVKPAPAETPPEVLVRRQRVAPKEDRSVTRTKVIIMLVLAIVIVVVATLISIAPDDVVANDTGGSSSTTTTTTAPTTTTLPSCDMCGKEIEGEVNVYVDSDGNEQQLCKEDYDFIVSIE